MIPTGTIDEIRNKADILQIVQDYVALKKRGKNYIGLCPFHSEKTPSFTVSTDKQIFHCFGCGEGGNVFAFLMKMESLSFAESVRNLGEKVGITVVNSGIPSQPTGDKEKYYDIMEIACNFFIGSLASDDGNVAREYIKTRGIDDETVNTFGLGSAPDKWDLLMTHLGKKGVDRKDMEKLGLIIERSDKSGYYDRFRNRLMFPVRNIKGNVIGFSGRILSGSAEEAKYINSPDSPIYNKGSSLYGIFQTKNDIKKARTAVLVEGNVDLLACWQHGIKNVTAPLGTALTQNQAKILKRFADNVVIAFDADAAGSLAAGRSVDILKEEGLDVHVAGFEGGKDPDEIIKNKGVEQLKRSINEAKPWIEYKLLKTIAKHDIRKVEGKAKAVREAAAIIGMEKDEFVRKGYIKFVSEILGYTYEEVSAEAKKLSFYPSGQQNVSLKRTTEKPKSKTEIAEEWLVKMSIDDPASLNMIRENMKLDDITGKDIRTIFELILSVDPGNTTDMHHFLLENLPDEGSKKELSRIMVSEFNFESAGRAVSDCIKTIKAHNVRSKMESIRTAMAFAEKEGSLDKLTSLQKEFQDASATHRSLSI